MLELCAEGGQELPLSRIPMHFCHGKAEADKGAVAGAGYTVTHELMRT